jgi:6 kDa early secretory antigenic target
MADDNIKVSFGSLEALAGDIGRRVDSIQGHVESLRSQIQNLETVWQGGAGEGFQATKAKWNTAADHLNTVLAKIRIAVTQSTDGYRDTEDRNKRRWDV